MGDLDVYLDAYPTVGPAPLTVTFNVSWSGGTPPYRLEINFDDGWGESIEPLNQYSYTTTHTYENPGEYHVTAKVIDKDGQEKSDDVTIKVTGEKVKLTITAWTGGSVEVKGLGTVGEGETKTFEVEKGSRIVLEARPKSGYEFDRWYYYPPGYYEYQNPWEASFETDITVYAYFRKVPVYHDVSIRVASGYGMICADSTCTDKSYWTTIQRQEGWSVTIKAIAAYSGWEFDYMVINGEKYTESEVTLTVDRDISAEAHFKSAAPPPQPVEAYLDAYPTYGAAPLKVYFNGSWSGGKPPYTVTLDFGDGSEPYIETTNGYSCNVTHTYNVPDEYEAKLTVTDSEGSSDEATVSISVSSEKIKLTVSAGAGGSVEVKDLGTVGEGQTKTFEVDRGATITFKANPKTGYEFDYWYRYPPGWREYSNPVTITLDYDTRVEAYFKKKPAYYDVSIRVASGQGTICADSTCTDESSWTTVRRQEGWTVTIRAIESYSGWEFDYMTINGEKYTDKEVQVTVTQNIKAEAYFKEAGAPPSPPSPPPPPPSPPTPECEEGETKCVGPDLYICQNGQWVLKEKNSPKCQAPAPSFDWTKILPIALIAVAGIVIVNELTK